MKFFQWRCWWFKWTTLFGDKMKYSKAHCIFAELFVIIFCKQTARGLFFGAPVTTCLYDNQCRYKVCRTVTNQMCETGSKYDYLVLLCLIVEMILFFCYSFYDFILIIFILILDFLRLLFRQKERNIWTASECAQCTLDIHCPCGKRCSGYDCITSSTGSLCLSNRDCCSSQYCSNNYCTDN